MPRIAKLHVLTGSIPCAYVEAALARKDYPFRRVELPFGFHRASQRRRYGQPTVPGITLPDGEKVIGSIAIVHRVDELVPEPALYPADPGARTAVEAAETWGNDVLAAAVRRIGVALLQREPSAMLSYAEASTLPSPRWLIRAQAGLAARRYGKVISADEQTARADIGAISGHLDHVDELIASSTIGGETPNGADLLIGAGVRSLATLGDFEPLLAGRPAARLAGWLEPMPGHIPVGTVPAEWLPA